MEIKPEKPTHYILQSDNSQFNKSGWVIRWGKSIGNIAGILLRMYENGELGGTIVTEDENGMLHIIVE